jgi:hypothetical protein
MSVGDPKQAAVLASRDDRGIGRRPPPASLTLSRQLPASPLLRLTALTALSAILGSALPRPQPRPRRARGLRAYVLRACSTPFQPRFRRQSEPRRVRAAAG